MFPSRGQGVDSRPWTTGEVGHSNEGDDESAGTTSTDGFLRDRGVALRQTRSADGLLLSSSSAHPDRPSRKADCSAEAGLASTAGNSDCAGDSGKVPPGTDGGDLPKLSADERRAGDQQGAGGVTDGDAGDGDDDIDDEDTEFPGELPRHIARRVSFADESEVHDSADGSLDSGEQRSSSSARPTEGWGAQRRRMSSLIGSSNGYLEGNGSINGQFLDENGRRKSDLDRCQKAMEIARAAHELLFNDTRPDGLRPITGSPMADGRDAQGSGGLFVGLAGLQGFDLSFLGARSTDQSGGGHASSSVSSRLAASRRLSSRAADATPTALDEKPLTADGTPASPLSTRGTSPSRSNASRMASGFLLDRKPGSLMANPPRSPGCEPSPGAAQVPPATGSVANTVTHDEEGQKIVRDTGSPKTVQNIGKSLTSTPPTEISTASPAGGEVRILESAEMNEIWHTPDIPEGLEKDGRGGYAPRGLREGTNSGETQREKAKREAGSGAGVLAATAASSTEATAMGSIFAPKAAVLWSARDLGVDELVSSVASGKEVTKPRPNESC